MINREFVYGNVLPLIREKGRMIDYYLVKSLFENVDDELIIELKKYQNKDLGFGNALEPDVRMPNSSVVATNIAISVLGQIKDLKRKDELIKEIVSFFEDVYDLEDKRFYMVSKEVDDYPRAVWWNYGDLKKNFPFGNPDPEVIGFLYHNRKHMSKLDINKLINQVVDYVLNGTFNDDGMHSLFSVLKFNKLVDKDVQNLIHDKIHQVVEQELEKSKDNWDGYSLEPYKVYVTDRHFVADFNEQLQENLRQKLVKVQNLEVMPNWKWYQFDDVFEKAKYDWIGYMYFEIIKALRLHREL